jgi:hypothetical protein
MVFRKRDEPRQPRKFLDTFGTDVALGMWLELEDSHENRLLRMNAMTIHNQVGNKPMALCDPEILL